MKKIIFLALLAALFVSCSKNDEPENIIYIQPPSDIQTQSDIERFLSNFNVKPSNSKEITYIDLKIDSSAYKIVGGKMNNNAWIAKFDKNGNEIFSYQFKDIPDQNLKFSYCNYYSIRSIDKNFIALVVWFSDNNDPNSYSMTYNYGSMLCVIDFNTGKEIHRFSFCNNIDRYDVLKTPFSYFIEASSHSSNYNVSKYYSISLDGTKFWERKLDETEKKGINSYLYCTFLDDENIFYCSIYREWMNVLSDENGKYYPVDRYTFQSINMRYYKLNYEVNLDFNHDKVFTDYQNTSYHLDTVSVNNGIIRIEYGEYQKIIVDSISGASHEEKINTEYYDIDKGTGNIITHGFLNAE